MPSGDLLNYVVAAFFALLVVALVFVLHRLYYVLIDLQAVLKNTEKVTADAKEVSADVKEMTASAKESIEDVKDKIISPITGSVVSGLINALISKLKHNKRRR